MNCLVFILLFFSGLAFAQSYSHSNDINYVAISSTDLVVAGPTGDKSNMTANVVSFSLTDWDNTKELSVFLNVRDYFFVSDYRGGAVDAYLVMGYKFQNTIPKAEFDNLPGQIKIASLSSGQQLDYDLTSLVRTYFEQNPTALRTVSIKMVGIGWQCCDENGFPTEQWFRASATFSVQNSCPDLMTHAGRMKAFKSGFKPDLISKDASNNPMSFSFAPICPSNGRPLELKKLANAMGFDHFNWWQSLNNPTSTPYSVSFETLDLLDRGIKIFRPDNFTKLDQWILDPQLEGKGVFFSVPGPNQTSNGYAIAAKGDSLPYYLNEGAELQSWTTKYSMKFFDAPFAPSGWFSPAGLNQAPTKFITRVAGVKSDGEFVIWSIDHNWTASKEDKCSDPEKPCAMIRSGISFGKNLIAPPGYEDWDGSLTYEGVSGLNSAFVPPLVGKNQLDQTTINEFINGTDFSITVDSFQSSDLIPEGSVISQIPEQWTAVTTPGEIRVVVSSGKPKDCGIISHGSVTTRYRYFSETVPFGTSCEAVSELQQGICQDGILDYQGTAMSETCRVLPPANTSCEKSIKKVCKAGILQVKECDMPDRLVSVKPDLTYKGSRCHEAPDKITLWNALLFINSYSNQNGKVKVLLGCDIRFDIKYNDICPSP